MLLLKKGLLISIPLVVFFCSQALAATPEEGDSISKGLDLLARFFMLAVVVEVAFSTLFQWKIFLTHLHDRGFKTPIIVITTFIFCKTANLDIVGDLVMELFPNTQPLNNYIGTFLTALLLAGGSSGMNTLFSKIKIRDPEGVQHRAEQLKAEMERKKAKADNTTEGGWKWIPRP